MNMKQITIVTVTALTLTVPAHATDCGDIADIAKSIMEARQSGVPVRDVLGVIGDVTPLIDVVMIAYNQPRQDTAAKRERAVQDFEDTFYIKCLERKRIEQDSAI